MPIGVMGCLPKMPVDYPINHPENAGNMVHANAPFKILHSAYFIKDYNYRSLGYTDFVDFVNRKCSHLIITLSNTLKLNDPDDSKYKRLFGFLLKIEKPVIVFGLGIQAKNIDIDSAILPQTAIELVKYLSSKSVLLGVRGEITKMIVDKLCGINNSYVTGCPSIFTDIESVYRVRENMKKNYGIPLFSGTRYFDDEEGRLLMQSIDDDSWLLEPVNKYNHKFYLKSITNTSSYEDIPYYLKKKINKNDLKAIYKVTEYFKKRYRLFRNIDDWYQFNRDSVSFSYGTRFHVNMATLISGKPALWITHDSRTQELVDFMCLPNISIDKAQYMSCSEFYALTNYEEFFDNYSYLIENFKRYLNANDLFDNILIKQKGIGKK
ncbi:polysaccharide pyruvyl transferase family protein [Chlorobium phaeobacteroides]|nr:polysaccharide pyruvyl transferase family protein [Chlorobium phaeobacteroides]